MTDGKKVSEGTLNAMLHGEQTSVSYLMALELKQFRDELAQRALNERAYSVAVGGHFVEGSLAMFERRAMMFIEDEQRKPNPDNALIAFACDAIRLMREYITSATQPAKLAQRAQPDGEVVASTGSLNDVAMIKWISDYCPTVGDKIYARAPEKWKPLPCAICGEPNTPGHHAAHDRLAQCQGKWVPLERLQRLIAWMQREVDEQTCYNLCDKTYESQGCPSRTCMLDDAKAESRWWAQLLSAAPEQKPCDCALRDWMETYHPLELAAFDKAKR